MTKQKKRGDPHVRVYAYEMNTPAWKTLSVDAKALLVEMRALFKPQNGNIVFFSVREAIQRLNIGQRRVQAARAELLERGWISIDEPGGFNRKTRHATSYRLENESSGTPGNVPRKEYMRWKPEKQR